MTTAKEGGPALKASRARRIVRVANVIAGLILGAFVLYGVYLVYSIDQDRRYGGDSQAAIGDMRTVVSAQEAYQSVSGCYGELRCLQSPHECLPGYDGPSFLDSQIASLAPRRRYHHALHLGLPGPTRQASPEPGRSLTPPPPGAPCPSTMAYIAVPTDPTYKWTLRSFCGDDTRRACANPKGKALQPVHGRCPAAPECEDLR